MLLGSVGVLLDLEWSVWGLGWDRMGRDGLGWGVEWSSMW